MSTIAHRPAERLRPAGAPAIDTDKSHACPLCRGTEHQVLESIPLDDLDALYRRNHGADVRRLFAGSEALRMLQCRECDLIWFDPQVPGDETFYNALQRFPWYYIDHKREYDVAAHFIKPQDRIVEVGAGKGSFGKFLGSDRYVGLDFSQEAVRQAADNGIDIRNESIADHAAAHRGEYDTACAFQVMEHVTDLREFLEALTDCLRPGGRLIVSIPSEESYLSRSRNLALNLPPHHLTRYRDSCLRRYPEYLPLRLVHLEHDPLQDNSVQDYLMQLYLGTFNHWLGRPYRSVDNSLSGRLLRMAATAVAMVMRSGLQASFRPMGHTVTAVYEKV